MEPAYFLTTARLGFRWWTADDAPLAQQLWGDPAVTHYIGGAHTPEQVAERFHNQFRYREQCGAQYWRLFLLTVGAEQYSARPMTPHVGPSIARPLRDDPVFVGVCGLRPAPLDRYAAGLGYLEMGFHLRPPFWRQGYGEEAARAVLAHAFDHFGVPAVYSCRHHENAASGNLILKLGFTPDGPQYVDDQGQTICNAFLLRREDRP